MPKQNTNQNLKDEINKSSFKIKPILLELQNYSFFHSVQKKEGEDINDRFLGRKRIIDRLKSFIHDTSKNTGAYLVTGFRGMGKTSLVNKALSSLNPNSRFLQFFLSWLLLLPSVVFIDDLIQVYNGLDDLWVLKSILVLIVFLLIYYVGHRDPRRQHNRPFKKLNWNQKVVNLIRSFKKGFLALFIHKFMKHKYMFQRIITYFLRFGIVIIFFVIYWCHYKGKYFEDYIINRHHFFWFITQALILWFLLYDILLEFIKYSKAKEFFKNWFKYFILIPILIFLVVILLHFQNSSLVFDHYFKSLILLTYFITKASFKSFRYKNSRERYKVILKRVISYFDLQHYITVRVNLGKDNLTEKDVLKYITNELYNKYRSWYYNIRNLKRLLNVTIILLLLYLSCTAFYNSFLGFAFKDFSIEQYKIAYFFPSQALLEKESNLSTLNIKEAFKKSDKKNSRILSYNSYISNLSGGYKVGYENLLVKENLIKQTIESKGVNTKITTEQTGQSLFNTVLVKTAMLSNELDFLILKLWHEIRFTIVGDQKSFKLYSQKVSPDLLSYFSSFYPRIPSLTVFLLMFLLVISYRFVPHRFILIKTHYYSIKRLKSLKDEIDASIIIEQGGGANNIKNSFFNYLKRTSYKPLESKDITQKLIHILEEIAQTNILFTKVRFIFVFDELDKINSHYNSVISNLEDEFDIDRNEVRYQARRKERIGMILSSMKHFLNSAHAKFIFIAGREMYDAALAGISDRESSLDSIFNDNKIYVNSFYTEKIADNPTNISSITERYLCQFLIPQYYLEKNNCEPSLKIYNDYLSEDAGFKARKYERIKIIATLKEFITYLTYRSNGAPRKLSSLIEQYIQSVSRYDISEIEQKKNIIVGRNDENLFLRLSYYDQYKFNLISYLTTPIFINLGNYIHEYSDKLLVSISYMLDHLFKHHKFGLSYRNLSLTPEIVDINKEPQFREFLDKLISYLSKSHLRPIVSGIYDYKFNGKIEAEIKFLSKINQQEAAALNFTLDESIELKRHFNRRLEALKIKDADVIVNNNEGFIEDYINNISLLHMTIGDLHFNDEEFQEAIVHYMDAVQTLRQKDLKDMKLYEFVLFVRNKLKLGLAFEKNKLYDSALMTFSELSDLIIRKRNIPLRKLGLARFVVKDLNNINNYIKKWYKVVGIDINESEVILNKKLNEQIKDNSNLINPNSIKDEIQYLKNIIANKKELVVVGRLNESIVKEFNNNLSEFDYDWKKLYPITDMKTFYNIKASNVIKNLDTVDTNYKPLKFNFLKVTGENIRVLYQPLISKLHLIEKSSPDKLQDIDIIRTIKEFNFIKLPLNTEDKRIIISEFYNKIGDLMYFKNGTLNKCIKDGLNKTIDNPMSTYKKHISNLLVEFSKYLNKKLKEKRKLRWNTNFDLSMYKLNELNNNLDSILEETNKHDINNSLTQLLENIKNEILLKGSNKNKINLKELKSLINHIEIAEDTIFKSNSKPLNFPYNDKLPEKAMHLLVTPLDATIFYIKSLAILLIPSTYQENRTIDINKFYETYLLKSENEGDFSIDSFFEIVKMNLESIIEKVSQIIKNNSFKLRYSKEYLFSVANGLIDLTESLTSYATLENDSELEITLDNRLNPEYFKKRFNLNMTGILNLYHYAAVIFKQIGEYRLARSQKLKILYVINYSKSETILNLKLNDLEFLKDIGYGKENLEDFINSCIKLSYVTYDESYDVEHKQDLFNIELETNSNNRKDVRYISQIGMEVDEAIAMYWNIVLKFIKHYDLLIKKVNKAKSENNSEIEEEINLKINNLEIVINHFFKTDLYYLKIKLQQYIDKNLTPQAEIKGKNNRLLMLSLLVEYNKLRYKTSSSYYNDEIIEIKNSKEFIILNSIGACNEIIKTHAIFDLNYVTTTNIGFAKAHSQMAFWCQEFENLLDVIKQKDKDELIDILKNDILNSKSLNYIDSNYHRKLSLEYNYKVRDFHTRGESLREFIKQASYLDDFFNDNLVHFTISTERNKYQEGDIFRRIRRLEKQIKKVNFEDYYA